jgi:hypothetical protein
VAAAGDTVILLVRHGPGRGRSPRFNQSFLDYVAAMNPALARRLVLHHTGEPRPRLEGVHAVVFWLADPLRERYPECFADAAAIADEAYARGIRVVNSPEALSNTIKSRQYDLWHAAGIPTPLQGKFQDRRELNSLMASVQFPAFIRADWIHGQHGMQLCATPDEARRIADGVIRYPGTLSPLVDTRSGFLRAGATGVWATYFHKKRVSVFGDTARSVHVWFSRGPIVGDKTSTFGECEQAKWRHPLTYARLRWETRACFAEDFAFAQITEPPAGLLIKAVRVLGLDLASLDYSTLHDGSVVVWEANAYVDLGSRRHALLHRERRMKRRTLTLYEDMEQFLVRLLDRHGNPGPGTTDSPS